MARWFHQWVRSPYAYPFLFLGVLIESTIFPWPVEFMLAAIMLEHRRHVLPAALIAIAGSLIGGVVFFVIGAYLFESLGQPMIAALGWEADFEDRRQRFQDAGFWIILIAAQTPVPFQVTALAAGVAGVPLWSYFWAAAIGRTVRYALMGVPVYFFGPALRTWWNGLPAYVRHGVLGLLVLVFVVTLVLPFVA